MSDELRGVFRRASAEGESPGSIETLYEILRRRRTRRRARRGTAALALSALSVAAVVVGVQEVGGQAKTPLVATSATPSASPSPSATAGPRKATRPPAPVKAGPDTVTDVDVVTATHAWAVLSHACPLGRCVELSRTTDGGRSWHRLPPTTISSTQFRNVTFVSDQQGFLFGGQYGGSVGLYETDDGGRSWRFESEPDVIDVVAVDGHAVRLLGFGGGCPGPCTQRVDYLDGSTWRSGFITESDIEGSLVSSGSVLYLVLSVNFAGGGDGATQLFRSGDGGHSWQTMSDGCTNPIAHPQPQTALAFAGGSGVALQCQTHISIRPLLAVSTDDGRRFSARRAAPGSTLGSLAYSDNRLVAATLTPTEGYLLSTSDDGGRTWTTRAHGSNSFVDGPAPLQKVAFASSFGIFLGPPSSLLLSRDSGNTWMRISVSKL